MCHMFAMSSGRKRVSATFWLLDATDSPRGRDVRPPDGAGLGTFDGDGEPYLAKQPIAGRADTAFAREARNVQSTTFVAHVRHASTGAVDLRNTHPFVQDGRIFAHNGVIENLEALDLETARDQLVKAAGVIEDSVIDLVGKIGRAVLARPMPDRRLRVSPRVVKRAVSVYAANTARGRIHGHSYKATLSIEIVTDEAWTAATAA